MKKQIFGGLLLVMGIMGILSSGITRADVVHNPDAGVIYTDAQGTPFPMGTITFDDGSGNIIMMLDRNLGATEAGTGETSYGYHFQFGNNYGFPSTGNVIITSVTSTQTVDISGYGPSEYISGVFIIDTGNRAMSNPTNLRGGGGDDSSNGWGLTSQAPITGRQGPCPEGYHVPTIGEWNILFKSWYNVQEGISSQINTGNLDYVPSYGEIFKDKFFIPFAGSQIWSGYLYDPNIIKLWSSSKDNFGDSIYYLRMWADAIRFDRGAAPAMAYPIRCFSNDNLLPKVQITFQSDDEIISNIKIIKGQTGIKPTDPTKTGYDFKYRYLTGDEDTPFDFENTPITKDITLYAKREGTPYTITLDLNGGTGIETTQTIRYGENISLGTPTRGGYRFLGREPALPDIMPAENLNVKATWKKRTSSSSGTSSSSSSETTTGSTTNTGSNNTNTGSTNTGTVNTGTVNTGTVNTGTTLTGDTQDSSDKSSEGQSGFFQEFIDAYNFAFQNGITTMPTIDQADMTGNLTRIQMAKMLSYYAINIMGKKPDETRNNKFNDINEKLNSDYNNGVTLAYQLGIMGINMPNNNFRPNDLVTRGEFVTALSRMIYGTDDGEYGGTSKYYTKHIEKLNEEEIIKQIDPSMKELRAYVMIMLKRASEK